MSTNTDGGPAFPAHDWREQTGMTLRDWFAGQALALMGGMTANPKAMLLIVGPDEPNDNKKVANIAYALADAMLEAREARS